MTSQLADMDNHPGLLLMGIGETLRRDLSKLVLMAAVYKAKLECKILQLFSDLLELRGEHTWFNNSRRRWKKQYMDIM